MPKQAPKQESQIKRFQLEIPKDPLPFKKPKKLLKKSEKISKINSDLIFLFLIQKRTKRMVSTSRTKINTRTKN